MRRFLLSTLCVLCSFASVLAQEWSLTLNASDGLPGVEKYYEYNPYYEYTSPLFTPGVAVDKVRITVVNTMSDEAPNGNNVVFALSGLEVTDGDGNKVGYTAYSNADHNTLAWQEDGDGLPALSDDDLKSYFHSMWLGNYPVADYHYVELELDNTISSFSLKWTTRLDGYSPGKNAPTVVGITLGSEYIPESVGSEFVLGDAVTMESELAAQNRLFVLRSNAIKSFTTSSGITYSGSGPLYMRYAEEGDAVASTVNVMQLIPAGDGRYLVYWPLSGKYLANSAGLYNGLNGWQFSTGKPKEAALVKFTAVAGKFEMQYDGANSSGDLSLYVGAELRDGVDSKMKTFDLFHKQALENGDYTQGFSLPVAFGWSVYEAVLDEATVNELMLSLSTIATTILQPVSDNAAMYLSRYGDHNGYCTNDENILLGDAISNAKNKMNDADNVSEILNAEIAITEALSHYMAAGLGEYDARVKELYSTSTFSSYPYTPGTYPEDSRSILESLSSMIASAKSAAGTYTPAQYEQIFNQLESEIGLFLSTKVEESVTPDGGDGGDDGDSDIELVEGEVVYVYLCDGGVDAYQLASLDGEYYEQDGKLFFPIKDGDLVYYTRSEYDSCSMVAPQLPTMTSFKFNNKYNPNLNVDVEAETIDTEMMLRVNSIGKWLTASFQLSDDKAVAYVDTVLQESKVTRHSFARDVTYKVTYPGYNIVQRVKVQDEIWSEGTNAVEVAEVALTEEMLATNKPSANSNEGLGNLLDNNASTKFHSTWGSANDNTVKVATYITIDLPEALDKIQLYYRCRTDAYGYNPKVWEIYASNTGDDWTLVRTLDYTADNMPVGGLGQEYQSPTIDLGGSYSKLKILQTEGEYSKNHFVLSELRLYKVVEGEAKEPEKIKDAIYENRNVPFGREYKVKVEWPTDNAVSVPRIDIDIEGGQTVTSKKYYLNAKFRITGYGVYDNFEDSVLIKGRGNSSWSNSIGSKNPYRLKFDEKVKPFGLTKGKSWVLLANKQTGSLMANAIAMKIGQMAGAAYTNHIIPVDLYINGEYRGNYMFTEKVGLANNSVDIDEALGYMLELDTNTDADEPIVRIGTYNLPMKVAEPDLDELTADSAMVRKSRMMTDLRALSDAVANGSDIEQHLDIEAAARFYLACDFALNQEICHPKSFFLFKDESAPDGKLTFGPIWDFDWAFGYEGSGSYCSNGETSSVIAKGMEIPEFWQDLTAYEEFKKNYYKVWKEFIDKNSMAELNDYIDSYYSFSKSSFDRNSYKWGDNFDEVDKTRAKQWLETRKNFIFSNLDVYDLDDLLTTLAGDVNCNNQITIHDAALIAAYLANDIHKDFREQKADYDNDGSVTLADAEGVAELVIESDVPSPAYWYSTPMAMGELYANDFELEIGSEVNVPLSISAYSTEPYNALQFDLEVPDGVFVNDIVPGEELDGCKFSYAQLGLNTYRVVMYAEDNVPFTTGDDVVANMNIMTFDVIEESLRKLNISNVYAVNGDNNEVRMNNVAIAFSESTGIDATLATIAVTGGDCITVTALEAQEVNVYSVDGRLVRSVKVNAGTTRIALPAGLYIVNGEKVLVK